MADSNFVPAYDHIVVVVEENHSYDEIIGNPQAPYINLLARSGALLAGYHAVAHPSEPNYFALYAGSTFGVADDGIHNEPGPTLASILAASGRAFAGYVESGSPSKHNPWESFPEGFSVERNVSNFPSDFSRLPAVSFVVPNLADDMHDGSVAQGDSWLQSHLDAYAHWAVANNSLLVVTFDEDDTSSANRVPTILLGAHIATGVNSTPSNHYDLLHTILQAYGLPAPNNAANAAGLDSSIFLRDSDRNQPLFGSITHDPNGSGGAIYAMYDGLLGRIPDQLGFENWTAALQATMDGHGGLSAQQIAHELLASPEFSERFGSYTATSDHNFVEDLYQTALHRVGDPQGEAGWENALSSGTSRDEIAYDFVFSAEHEQDLSGAFSRGLFVPNATDDTIARLYYATLNRAPDAAGLQDWENAAANGLSLHTIAQDFVSSTEHHNVYGTQTNQQFIDALYQAALGRSPDATGEHAWVSAIDQGTSRGRVALDFAQSPEAEQHLAVQIEYGFRLA